MPRRWWLGAAAAAGLAGVGTALWRYQPTAVAPSALDALWALTLDDPQGTPVALSAFRGKPLLVNFWATWCPPCVEELPMLNAFYGQQRSQGWQVLGLAVDQPSAVRTFLQRLPLDFPVVMAGLGGTDLAKSLGNSTGGLPFTVVVDAKGVIAHRKLGKVSLDDLKQWAQPG
jgi:peroxiredoxin